MIVIVILPCVCLIDRISSTITHQECSYTDGNSKVQVYFPGGLLHATMCHSAVVHQLLL